MTSSDQGAPWAATMQELAGTKEFPGGANNPVILGWASFIANRYPEMAAYCESYTGDDIAWCGLTMAYTLAKNGIRPPFGATDTERFLWANSFAPWGLVLSAPRPGAIVVFLWPSGGGHVGIIDHVDGKTLYVAGGNQSDMVNVTPFAWDGTVVGFFWPPQAAPQPAQLRTPADVRMRMGKAITLAEARRDANGNLAVYYLPANDGGGTYEVAGINERYHPVEAARLKAMIAAGRYSEAEDFVGQFTASYTDVADLWTSSWGIEFYLRSCVFHRGPTGAAKVLQRALIIRGDMVGPDGVDGDVGPNTMAAIGRQEGNVEAMLAALRQAREAYEREDVGYRANFWNGLVNRWNNDLTIARQFNADQAKEPPVTDQPTPTTNDQVLSAIAGLSSQITQLIAQFRALLPPAPIADLPKPKPEPEPELPAPAPAPATPVLQQPGVGLGVLGALLSGILNVTGVTGPMTGDAATTTGQMLPLISAGIAALGATGMFGTWGNALSTVLSAFSQKK